MNMTPASTSLDVEVPTQLQNPIGENNSSNTDDTCTVPQASEPHRSTSSDVHATVQPSAACYESPSNSSMPQSSDGACSLNTVPSSNVNHNTTMLTQGSPQPHLAATTFVNFSPLPMQMCPSVGMMPARQTLINPSMTNSTPAQAMMPPQRMVAAAPQHRMGMQQSNNGMGSIRPSALMPHMMGYQYGMRPPMISSGVPPHVNPHITPRQHLYSQMPWEIRAQGPQMMHRPYSMMNSGYPQQNSMMGQQPGGPPPPTPHHGTMLTAGQPQMPMARPPGLFICRNQQVRHIQHRSPQQQQLMQQQLQNQQTQQQQEQSLYANQ